MTSITLFLLFIIIFLTPKILLFKIVETPFIIPFITIFVY
ncbi:hypothetical protein GCWU000323_00411 [Leptotrichia hofstadii F0254]|uniref:Uncharacterized protein n=1 Tax=Leptotrichia hofstadii F0254 TaxID=634994 RepID=C9MVX2_9FUSO|nr:hypothetical protein GCWU000323_00411 [Leptotrichia hofstadii F0254]